MRIIQILWQLFQRYLFNRAMDEELDDDVCVACESTNITRLAEGAYRCDDCGYEGGSNYGDYKQQQERERVDELPDEERRERGIRELRQARDSVGSGIDTLQSAKQEGMYDLMGLDDPTYMAGGGDSKHEELLDGLRYFREAENLIDDAAYKLDIDVPPEVYVQHDFDEFDTVLDNFADSIGTDLLSQNKLNRIENHGEKMRDWIDQTLRRVQ